MLQSSAKFQAQLWKYQAPKAAWYFITLPKEDSLRINHQNLLKIKGWGSIPVEVKIGQNVWRTSIFPSSKSGCYILPIKAEIRKKEKISEGDVVNVEFLVV